MPAMSDWITPNSFSSTCAGRPARRRPGPYREEVYAEWLERITLNFRGTLDLATPRVAIVGSRTATAYGEPAPSTRSSCGRPIRHGFVYLGNHMTAIAKGVALSFGRDRARLRGQGMPCW